MEFVLIGLPALIFLVGFVVVFSAPVWFAAGVIGAKHATLLHAVVSLAAGMLASYLLAMLTGPWVLLLAPLGFLLSFKYILGTSFLGSVLLAILAGLVYAALVYFIGSSFPGVPMGGQGIAV